MLQVPGISPHSLGPGGCEHTRGYFIYKRFQTHPRNPNTPTRRREQRRVTALVGSAAQPYHRISKADCQQLLFDTGPVTRNVGILHV